MAADASSHLQRICSEWAAVRAASADRQAVAVTGGDLTIADVVAVALHGIPARLTADPAVRDRMAASVDFLASELAAGKVIYGVNTGFGGSADTRTQQFHRLQSALVQHLNVGILLPADRGQTSPSATATTDLLRSHALPPAIVRATMLIRSNSLARGHSAVRVDVAEALLRLLAADMTPVVPLRGSISASGDLSPLSYVAGFLEGNPGVYVRCGDGAVVSADTALHKAGVAALRLQAKEGLGITNGTAPSAAAASIAVHLANQLAIWTQLLTAMGTEALAGTAANYDDFIARARPHRGQAEAAGNIRGFLAGSRLCAGHDAPAHAGLAQDRYALRTAPQWIGPQLEDLALATQQVATELNATTDNPLVDAPAGRILHGGNFQAMAVTSAMEKTLMALQNLGRLLFAQSSELVDHARNRGLPPSLSADDPSTSFLCKGFDVNMAAYQAELAYLARPVSAHVQVAEMANQAVNSMALVAARYALEAGEVVALMVATYVFVLCQALDLRCMQHLFREAVAGPLRTLLSDLLTMRCSSSNAVVSVATAVVAKTLDRWDELSHLNLHDRSEAAVRDTTGTLLVEMSPVATLTTEILLTYQSAAALLLADTYDEIRSTFFAAPAPASAHLSPASRVVYEYVRLDLHISMHRGIDDHPTLVAEAKKQMNGSHGRTYEDDFRGDRTRVIGTLASDIYMAVRDGRLFDRIVAFCEETTPWSEK